jgi:hypothetical protein
MLSDEELQADIGDIDAKLESQSAWLTPRFRDSLLAARAVLVNALDRRRTPWPGRLAEAGPQPGISEAPPWARAIGGTNAAD